MNREVMDKIQKGKDLMLYGDIINAYSNHLIEMQKKSFDSERAVEFDRCIIAGKKILAEVDEIIQWLNEREANDESDDA